MIFYQLKCEVEMGDVSKKYEIKIALLNGIDDGVNFTLRNLGLKSE